jgi:hypothetical protein
VGRSFFFDMAFAKSTIKAAFSRDAVYMQSMQRSSL